MAVLMNYMPSGMAEYTRFFFFKDRLIFGQGINFLEFISFIFYAINLGPERFKDVLKLPFPIVNLFSSCDTTSNSSE